MSRLDDAKARLEAAMTRLEAAAEARLRDCADRDALKRDLDAAQGENERLRRTNEDISGRLDAAIDRVKAILEA